MTTDKRGVPRPASAAPARSVLLRDRVDDASQTPPSDGECGSGPLRGEVEVDDTWVGGEQAGLRGSRQLKERRAALVRVAVEKRGQASGRVRMSVIPRLQGRHDNAVPHP
jgi:ISXO2 transposase-like protein